MDNSPEPDSCEKRLRFGCGFTFGAVVSFISALEGLAPYTGTFWAAVLGVAVITGLLAVRYGDDFWRKVLDWFRWL